MLLDQRSRARHRQVTRIVASQEAPDEQRARPGLLFVSGRTAIATSAAAGKRLWRLRKRHQWVDAELRNLDDARVSLHLYYNGTLAYERQWDDQGLALQEASQRRQELEREGWIPHW